MVVVETTGKSFKGLAAYLLHDKEQSESAERVAWTHTENLWTDDPAQAVKAMQYTGLHQKEIRELAGENRGKTANQINYHLVMSWTEGETPSKKHMIEEARSLLAAQGLQEHEALMVAHIDTPRPHLHIMVNIIHPENGLKNKLKYSKEKNQKWAGEYQRRHNQQHLCPQREINAQKRKQARAQPQQQKKQFPRYKNTFKHWDREAYEIEQQKRLAEAAEAHAKQEAENQRRKEILRKQIANDNRKKQQAVETWAAKQQNRLELQQFDRQQEKERQIHEGLEKHRENLEKFYELDRLRAELQAARQAGKREETETARRNLDDAQRRYQEMSGKFESKAKAEQEKLERDLQGEREALRQQLDHALKTGRIPEDKPEEKPEPKKQRGRGFGWEPP
jgi:hypothetical protein